MSDEGDRQRRLMLEGIDAALQGKVAKLFDVYSSAGYEDETAGIRFKRGLDKVAEDHENARAFVEQMFDDDEPVEA